MTPVQFFLTVAICATLGYGSGVVINKIIGRIKSRKLRDFVSVTFNLAVIVAFVIVLLKAYEG